MSIILHRLLNHIVMDWKVVAAVLLFFNEVILDLDLCNLIDSTSERLDEFLIVKAIALLLLACRGD